MSSILVNVISCFVCAVVSIWVEGRWEVVDKWFWSDCGFLVLGVRFDSHVGWSRRPSYRRHVVALLTPSWFFTVALCRLTGLIVILWVFTRFVYFRPRVDLLVDLVIILTYILSLFLFWFSYLFLFAYCLLLVFVYYLCVLSFGLCVLSLCGVFVCSFCVLSSCVSLEASFFSICRFFVDTKLTLYPLIVCPLVLSFRTCRYVCRSLKS